MRLDMEINSDKEYLRHVDTSTTTTDMFDHLINQYGHIKVTETENRYLIDRLKWHVWILVCILNNQI